MHGGEDDGNGRAADNEHDGVHAEVGGEAENNADSVCKNCTGFTFRFLFFFFYFLCSLTGQLMVRSECFDRDNRPVIKVILRSWIFVSSTLFLIIFGIANFLSFIFDIVAIIWCPFEHCGYIYVSVNKTWHNLTNHTGNTTSVGGPSAESLNQYDDWQKTVITTATISGLLSYYWIVILVLCPLYGVCNPCSRHICDCVANIWKKCGQEDAQSSANNEELLNPFIDSNESPYSTSLQPRQSFYFHLIFWMNLLIFAAGVVVFFIILADRIDSKDNLLKIFDITGLTAQFGSQFCAIMSCFIFSKVAYAVSSRYLQMEKSFDKVNQEAGVAQWNVFLTELETDHYIKPTDRRTIAESDTPHLTTLKVLDKWYVRRMKGSLDPYGTWFAIHWLLYTLTAFMSITYFAETVLEDLYGFTHKECHSPHNISCNLDLAYIALFMLEHCILFLYPCFRAASVTAARQSLIKRVSKADWNHIPALEKESFCTYLNNYSCSFEISILCAKLPFGFSLAYVSIFFGVFGVILKLSI